MNEVSRGLGGGDDTFTDRQSALEAFTHFLTQEGCRVLIYWGLAGQGKSTLLRELVRSTPPGRHRALIDLDGLLDFDDRRTAASDLVEVIVRRITDVLLRQSGTARRMRYGLRRYRFRRSLHQARRSVSRHNISVAVNAQTGGQISGSTIKVATGDQLSILDKGGYRRDLLAAMTNAVRGLRCGDSVLLFDTTERLRYLDDSSVSERTSTAVRHWFVAELVPALCEAVPDLKIVLAGRENVRIPAPIDVHSVELTEWTREDSEAYLRRRGISSSEIAHAIYDCCGGVPVWTSLMADLHQQRRDEISPAWLAAASRNRLAGEWLPREFLRRLTADSRAIVLAASTLRVVRKEAIEFMLADDAGPARPNWYAELLEQSFVRTAYGIDGSRESRVHELVRVAALEYLGHDEPTRFDQLQQRAAEYYRRQGVFLEEAYHRFAAGDLSLASRWRDSVQAALDSYKIGKVLALTNVALTREVAGRLVTAAPELLGYAEYSAGWMELHQGHLPEARRQITSALGRTDDADVPWRATALELLGDIAVRNGDLGTAETHYRAELAAAERVGQVEELMGALSSLGDIARRRRRLDEATVRYERCLELAISNGHGLRQGKTLRTLGRLALQQGDLPTAASRFHAALEALDKAGDPLEKARTLNALSELLIEQRGYDQALARLSDSIALCRSLGSPQHEANSLVLMGDALVGLGSLERAVEHFDAALRIFDRAGGLLGRARVLRGLGDAAVGRREAAVAAEWYGQAMEAFGRVEGRLGEARAAYSRWFVMAKADVAGHPEAEAIVARLLVESRTEDLRRRVATHLEALWTTGRGPQVGS